MSDRVSDRARSATIPWPAVFDSISFESVMKSREIIAAETREMIRLRVEDRMKLREIGDLFGLTRAAVSLRLRGAGHMGHLEREDPVEPDWAEIDDMLDRWWLIDRNSVGLAARGDHSAVEIERRRRQRGLVGYVAAHPNLVRPRLDDRRPWARRALRRAAMEMPRVTTASYARWQAVEATAGRHWPSMQTLFRSIYPEWSWADICEEAGLDQAGNPHGGPQPRPKSQLEEMIRRYLDEAWESGRDASATEYLHWSRANPPAAGPGTIRYRYGTWSKAVHAAHTGRTDVHFVAKQVGEPFR
jgi:hypothetical protein